MKGAALKGSEGEQESFKLGGGAELTFEAFYIHLECEPNVSSFFPEALFRGPDITSTNHQPALCFIIHVRQSSQMHAAFFVPSSRFTSGIHQTANLPNEL